MALRLKPGKFYVSSAGERWCCYRVDEREPKHCQAQCVQVETNRIEYFYLDGRYDTARKSEHTLVREAGGTVPSPEQDLLERLYAMAEPALEDHHCRHGDGNGVCTCDACSMRQEVQGILTTP